MCVPLVVIRSSFYGRRPLDDTSEGTYPQWQYLTLALGSSIIGWMKTITSKMNVSLPKKQEQYVKGLVKKGRYNSASEVVRTGLRLLEERDAKITKFRAFIQKGLDSGTPIPWDPEEFRIRARERMAELRAGKEASA